MSLFYVTDKKHLDFNEVVEGVQANKGAVSKKLKLLSEVHRINVISNAEDSRKKLYYLDTENLIKFLELVINKYIQQSDLLHKVLEVRTDENNEMNEFIERSIAFNDEMLNFLDKKSILYLKLTT